MSTGVFIKGEFYDNIERIILMLNQAYNYATGLDWLKYILDLRMTEEKLVLRYAPVVNDEENDYIIIGDDIVTTDCLMGRDSVCSKMVNRRLVNIFNISKTESIDVIVKDYNRDKHALNVEIIWVISD